MCCIIEVTWFPWIGLPLELSLFDPVSNIADFHKHRKLGFFREQFHCFLSRKEDWKNNFYFKQVYLFFLSITSYSMKIFKTVKPLFSNINSVYKTHNTTILHFKYFRNSTSAHTSYRLWSFQLKNEIHPFDVYTKNARCRQQSKNFDEAPNQAPPKMHLSKYRISLNNVRGH